MGIFSCPQGAIRIGIFSAPGFCNTLTGLRLFWPE
jgi:hypothetical protein